MANKFLGDEGTDVIVEKIKALRGSNPVLKINDELFDLYGRIIDGLFLRIYGEYDRTIYDTQLVQCKRSQWVKGDGLYQPTKDYFPVTGIWTFGTVGEYNFLVASKTKYLGNIRYSENIRISPNLSDKETSLHTSTDIEFYDEYPSTKIFKSKDLSGYINVDISYPNITVDVGDTNKIKIFESVCPPKTENRTSEIKLTNNSASSKMVRVEIGKKTTTIEVSANGEKSITFYFINDTNSYNVTDGIGEVPRDTIPSYA